MKEAEAFQELEKEIKQKNLKYFLIKNIFSNEFADFMHNLLTQSNNIYNGYIHPLSPRKKIFLSLSNIALVQIRLMTLYLIKKLC